MEQEFALNMNGVLAGKAGGFKLLDALTWAGPGSGIGKGPVLHK